MNNDFSKDFDRRLKRLEEHNNTLEQENRLFKRILIPIGVLIFLSIGGILWSEQISVPNTFSGGTLIKSSQINENFSDIYALLQKFSGIAIIQDVRNSGVSGGACTPATWNLRNLNTLVGSTDFVTLNASSSQFILEPGKYLIGATAAAHAVNRHKLRIRNITNGSTAIIGISHYASRSGSLDNSDNDASLTGILEINATTTYELQHYCEGSENVGDRLGVATSSGENEIYSTLTIQPIL